MNALVSLRARMDRLHFIAAQPWFEQEQAAPAFEQEQAFAAAEIFEGVAAFEKKTSVHATPGHAQTLDEHTGEMHQVYNEHMCA